MIETDEDRLKPKAQEKESNFEDDSVPVKTSRLCPECRSNVNLKATICPNCGVRVKLPPASQRKERSRITAALLALFLGVAGAHKFYLGNAKMGIIYILISLTAIGFVITALLGIYDCINLLAMSDADFAQRYS